MRYRLIDGAEVAGSSYTSIVQAMNDQKMTPARDLAVYRRALADRIKEAYGHDIDAATDKSLVQGMESVGLVTRV